MTKRTVQQETVNWMKGKYGKCCFAPFTGQDWSVFNAYCYLLEAWFRGDDVGRPHIIAAMRSVLQACQPCVFPYAKDAIIAIGDYGFVNEIWPKIRPYEVVESAK